MIVLEFANESVVLREVGFPARTLDIKVDIKRSMDGQIRTTKQTPVTTSHEQEIVFLSKVNMDAFIEFIFDSMGGTIKYTDGDSVVWYVKITSEPAQIVDAARSRRTCTLQMVSVDG
jgi:hypothetical protein